VPSSLKVIAAASIEVMTADERILGGRRFTTTAEGHRAMRAYVAQWRQRVWAIEGCSGIGGHVANRLLAEDEQLVDVPPKLSARTRVFSAGQGRKTDATDAHSQDERDRGLASRRGLIVRASAPEDNRATALSLSADGAEVLATVESRMARQLELLCERTPDGSWSRCPGSERWWRPRSTTGSIASSARRNLMRRKHDHD
jgi:hypothetical protein